MKSWKSLFSSNNSTIKSWKNMKEMQRQVSDLISKDKSFSMSNPTSIRSFGKGPDNTYISGDVQKGKGLPTEVEVASSAVKDVKYDPKRNIASIRFVGGDKFYDFDVTPEEFEAFMAADSKGRHVNYVWKVHNSIYA